MVECDKECNKKCNTFSGLKIYMNTSLAYSFLLVIGWHPILHIYNNSEYQAKRKLDGGNQHISYYLDVDAISILCTDRKIIIISLVLSLLSTGLMIPVLMVPLILVTWVVFIRDRFKSVARGQGAPGYFSFLNSASIF